MAENPPYEASPWLEEVSARTPDSLLVGWFRFYFADERWEWSAETARIHGYEPGTVTPTTELVMSHKHPDDAAKLAAHLDTVRRTHEAVSTRHRIIDAQGRTREVVVAGLEIVEDNVVIGTSGLYIDVTPTARAVQDSVRTRERALTDKLAVVVDGRASIDTTKGMLMLIYGIDAEKAFGLLKWRSQETNVKLRVLAAQLAEEFLAVTNDGQLPQRAAFDAIFLTAHQRLPQTPA
ncbi:putative transcription antitermination regulator [Mycobacterium antarcticum]|uniref:PAS and ANTAR domain-containing protein n=1 Tax=Mycolicibacterium sp. TUM20983 TaxID=3023369 RepID=UPI0023842F03|nr:PAS and ANTAR domain-containing protein [Mycolicibacterium sp. TUM20983]GLP77817.1 putative transcription antitermination regulator [Mycolicibacterium sp. TUM20983]